MQNTNQFAVLWALGYRRLVPITPPGCEVSEKSSLFIRIQKGDDARGKAPGRKWGDGTWSGFDWLAHTTTEADLERWNDMGAGVGIRTGDGLVLIDADTKDVDRARVIRDTVIRHFGQLPIRIGNYPKAGYLVRTDADFQYTRIEFGERDAKGRLQERVEILAEGRQFVAHGIHPATQQPYRWPQGLPALADVPEVTGAALLAFLEDLRPQLPAASEIVREGAKTDVDQKSLLAPIDLLTRAVRATPNSSEHFPTRESYLDFGYAIKAAAGPEHQDEAFELFADWCDRWAEGENEPEIVRADWGRMKGPFRRGASWLYETAARLADPGEFSLATQWFEEPGEDTPLFPDSAPNAFSTPKKVLAFTAFDEAAANALDGAAAPLIKGILDQGAMTILYGESNAGKTFVAMDIAYHIARGLPWAGRKTAAMPVLYIAAEGGKGARKRAAALAARHGAAPAFWFLMHPVNLLRVDADLKPLVEAVRLTGQAFGMIVVDTLSRAMAGGDENASTDMGAMVRNLDALRSATGAHLVAVHHSGKDRAKGARGHSLLRAATDTEIEVVDGTIVVTKQRDLDGSFATGFDLDVVTLGVDGDGDPVTSCTIRLIDIGMVGAAGAGATAGARGEITAKEGVVLQAVRDLTERGEAVSGVSLTDILSALADLHHRISKDSARKHVEKLTKKGLLTKCRSGFWKLALENLEENNFHEIFE